MSKYDLIAFDMDGTLLNSSQTISPQVASAMEAAIDAGKEVVICTGRGPKELMDFDKKEFARIRYYVTENGGYVYDSIDDKEISASPIPGEYIEKILDAADGEDAMLVFQGEGQNKGNRKDISRMEYFHAARYKDIETRSARMYDDMVASYRQEPMQIEKLNVYAATEEIRDRIYGRIRELPVTIVFAEETGFEVTPLGMSKAVGLRALCETLHIPVERIIAVGDSDNDVEMLKLAGLPVAMGNARACVREVSKVVVADNDHDGCKEAIEKYLLAED